MAPVIESATVSTLAAEATSFVMNMPAVRPAGDLYLFCAVHSLAGSITPPAAVTEIDEIIHSGGSHAMWVGRLTGAIAASYTFEVGEDLEEFSGVVLRISGADPNSPIHLFSSAEGASAAPTLPALSPTLSDVLLVGFAGADGPRAKTPYEPEDWDAVAQSNSSGAGALAVVMQCASKVQAAPGSTGTPAFAISTADQWVTTHLAIAAQQAAGGSAAMSSWRW